MSHEYLLIKRGLFYRPDAHGYTASLADAGIYTLEHANKLSATPGVTKLRLVDALDALDQERRDIAKRLEDLAKFERRALGLREAAE